MKKQTELVLGDLDVFYISYDEPAKEEHWANLMMKFPFAKRVDGVKGFDNAHKECARQSETERFITIDGDNIVDERFFDLAISIPPGTDLATSIISWSAKNQVNGLVYGNGGIKCWPVDLVLEMKTHENAEDETKKVDFCWDLNYIQMNNIYSEVFNAGSPFQAFRAGYREGVKMSLDGCYDVNFVDDYKLENISSFDWFKSYFEEEVMPKVAGGEEKCSRTGVEWDYDKLYDECLYIGDILNDKMSMEIVDPTPELGRFWKVNYHNPPRVENPLATEKQTGWDR